MTATRTPGFPKVNVSWRRWIKVGVGYSPPGRPEHTGMRRDVDGRRMSSEVLANCRRCGQPVRESHSHVMIVPVGRARMFFHGGCGADRTHARSICEEEEDEDGSERIHAE